MCVVLLRVDGPVLLLCVDYKVEGEILDVEKDITISRLSKRKSSRFAKSRLVSRLN